jgi:hypothetical protein
VILVLAAVLGSFVHSDYSQQLLWLLYRPLRYPALLRALESIGAEPPILGLGACQALV